jgi:hypothetical protein
MTMRGLDWQTWIAIPALPRYAGEPAVKLGSFDGRRAWRWLFVAGLFLAGSSVGGFLAPAAEGCRVDPAYPVAGADADVAMTVRHNISCTVMVKIGNIAVSEMKTIHPPQHGTAVKRGRTGYIYHPAQRAGGDFFAFRLRGKSANREVDTVIRVAVTVK